MAKNWDFIPWSQKIIKWLQHFLDVIVLMLQRKNYIFTTTILVMSMIWQHSRSSLSFLSQIMRSPQLEQMIEAIFIWAALTSITQREKWFYYSQKMEKKFLNCLWVWMYMHFLVLTVPMDIFIWRLFMTFMPGECLIQEKAWQWADGMEINYPILIPIILFWKVVWFREVWAALCIYAKMSIWIIRPAQSCLEENIWQEQARCIVSLAFMILIP